jgi:argininosuccinate synthase
MIHSIDDIKQNISKNDRIVVLYSGGLDGTYLLAYLKELGYTKIVALHIDICGEGYVNIESRLKALEIDYVLLDKVSEFIQSFVFKAINAKALYNGIYPISASLSRPLISKSVVEFVSKNYTEPPILLHTSNSTQNSLRRFNNSLKDLGYSGNYGTPFENTHTSRIEKLTFLLERGIAFDLKVSSEDTNVWCREFEYGEFDNIENIDIPIDAYLWTRPLASQPENIKVKFKNGVPIELNNKVLNAKELVISIRNIVGKFGIGRYVGLEEISTGQRVLEIRESPSATILIDAFRLLEMATFNYDTISEKTKLEYDWTKEASEGKWFSSNFTNIDSKISKIANLINGTVTFKLIENSYFPISVISQTPNYIINRDEFELRQS